MKSVTLKIKSIILFIMATFGFTANAVAHDQIGTLLDPASATDYYLVTCSTGGGGESDRLEVRIKDLTTAVGGGKLSAVVQNDVVGVVATASDPVRVARGEGCEGWSNVTQDTEFGEPVSISAGNGAYTVMVHKQKAGPKTYSLEYHCKSSTGLHTGTALLVLQDQ